MGHYNTTSIFSNFSSTTTILISNVTSAVTEAVNLSIPEVTQVYDTEILYTEKNANTQSDKPSSSISPIPKVTTNKVYSTTTIEPFDEFGPPEGIEYIFVPLGVMIFVILLSAVVFIISRKRKMERLRHRLMPLYNFDPSEEGEDDWETELLDEGFNSRQRRQVYRSMDRADNVQLFSEP